MRYLVGTVAIVLGLITPAWASCEWKWACDGSGNCQHVPLCDSSTSIYCPTYNVQPVSGWMRWSLALSVSQYV